MSKDEQIKELKFFLDAALQYIDALPKDIVLPAMPGFDRDKAEEVLATEAE